ncbi:ABC transporter substrate-binding protein [Actinorugispora endophytica]|uniref:Carbohydrate ABC transporter substrate-binding protein (CUT1 family) n=1 Tax=Actinorugispora endophytica TaxID=1605990 RepID=A0A4R6UXX2_9ACTN|nr:extracellular solute-binding protein [Actinorugispora endophytica]TDQ50783.1 carbohydrate ABC transporter substrate-binding protein (CUT1 family) [Actinorugispora endophytica]
MRRRTPWPRVIGSASLALVLGLTTACGTSGPGTEGGVEVWALEDAAVNPIVQSGIDTYNESAETPAELVTYVNDAYKQRLQVALGSPNAPDVFFNWGGGNLAQYVEEGQVVDLTDTLEANPGFRDAFLPSVLDVARVEGRYYGVPMLGVLPVVLFYNKEVFDEAGLEPPATYDELLDAVDVFKEEGVTPITLPGAQGWTELMWLEYLLDRVGGADKFQAIVDGEEGAWSDPAVIEALRMCQDLADRGAFGTNFASITYDNASASSLLASGKSAMFLMGTWDFSTQMDNNPDFVESGDLGFVPFPEVEGGEGEPGAVVGNPSNYFSVNADSADTDAAIDFLTGTVASDSYVEGLIEAGQVPAVEGIEDRLSETDHADFTTFTYNLVADAPSFTQSWDQALTPATSEELLTNLQLLFLGDLGPEEFARAMEGKR